MGQWWTTRTWWIHLILWIVVLDVVSALVVRDPDLTAADALAEAIRTFLLMCAAAVAVGVVVTVQGAVVGEKELGTAAWVISKPVSRRSFITAKLVAHVTGFLVTAVVVPALGFILVAQTADVPSIDLGRFAAGVAVVALAVSFYVVLTLALGVLFTGRGPIAGIGVGLVLTGLFFRGMLPTALVVATPWPLGDVAASLALGTDLDFTWYVPVLINVATGAALLTIALWRFEREEL
jgi:ABC-2 type transport system permease protein